MYQIVAQLHLPWKLGRRIDLAIIAGLPDLALE
jgi:hypothetical protein